MSWHTLLLLFYIYDLANNMQWLWYVQFGVIFSNTSIFRIQLSSNKADICFINFFFVQYVWHTIGNIRKVEMQNLLWHSAEIICSPRVFVLFPYFITKICFCCQHFNRLSNIIVTDDHDYVLFIVAFRLSLFMIYHQIWLIWVFTRHVWLMEQELLILLEHLISTPHSH